MARLAGALGATEAVGVSEAAVSWVEVTAGGYRWQVRPELRERLVGPAGLRLDEWLRDGLARVVKHGPHRTVYHVALPGLMFYLKHFRASDFRARARGMVRPAKARLEYDRAVAVAARRVPTVTPLGLGVRHHGPGRADSFLITRGLDDVEPLSDFLETTLPGLERARQTRLRFRLAVELARLIAHVHDAGIAHHDLHAANLLVRLGPGNYPHLYLIDLHAIHLRRPLGWRASRANLVLFNRWFSLRASRADRLRFWKGYCRLRFGWTPGEQQVRARDLEAQTLASNLSFWKRRDRRCLEKNRRFKPVAGPGVHGHVVRDLDRSVITALLADPDEPFRRPGVTLLKDSPSATVAEFDLSVNGVRRQVIYKRFRLTSWLNPWLALLRPSPALRSWVHGHGLRERCLPTPRPLLVLHRGRHGLDREGYLLTEKVPDAIDLRRYVDGLDRLPPAERRATRSRLIECVARLVRDLHERRLSHRDLKAANILLERGVGNGKNTEYRVPSTGQSKATTASPSLPPAPRPLLPTLIDLVGVTRHRYLRRGRRVQNLTRLHASFYASPALTRTDKLRFLRTYLQWGLRGRGGWKSWWKDVERATRAKVARNRRNGRPLA